MTFPQDKEQANNLRAFWKRRQFFPADEFETIKLFEILGRRIGWEIVYLSSNSFPDAIIEKNGQQLIAEFEHCAKNFLRHGHDPEGCDLIICWFNDWPDAPLPVWALIDCGNYEAYYFNEVLNMHYVSKRTLIKLRREVRDFIREVREALDLDVDDPDWREPSLEEQFSWVLDTLHNPPKGFLWALGLAAASQHEFDTETLNWWLKSATEIRK